MQEEKEKSEDYSRMSQRLMSRYIKIVEKVSSGLLCTFMCLGGPETEGSRGKAQELGNETGEREARAGRPREGAPAETAAVARDGEREVNCSRGA